MRSICTFATSYTMLGFKMGLVVSNFNWSTDMTISIENENCTSTEYMTGNYINILQKSNMEDELHTTVACSVELLQRV
jgi:hypothetical protein